MSLTTILLNHATLSTRKEGYPKLHEDKTKEGMGSFQLEKHIPLKRVY
jgi:hypothetical protein